MRHCVLRRGVVSEQWSLRAVPCLIQAVAYTGLTVFQSYHSVAQNAHALRVFPGLVSTIID